MAGADKLFKRLTAARLDNTLDYEYRRLTTVELLIIDDFALQPLTPAQTTDFYEIITDATANPPPWSPPTATPPNGFP